MANDWRSNYFNLNNETQMSIRETIFVNVAGKYDFWTQSACHRVFGLYVKRMKKVQKTGQPNDKDSLSFKLTTSIKTYKSILPGDYHNYALYWPINANYPAFMNAYYFNDQNHIERFWSDQTGYARECIFYQSITSMLVIGRIQRDDDDDDSVVPTPTPAADIELDKEWLYFHQTARKQLGQHVYITEIGFISTAYIAFNLLPPKSGRRQHQHQQQQQQENRYEYKVSKVSTMSALYPTIRNEWYERDQSTDKWTEKKKDRLQVLVQQVFTMGLAFRRFGPNNESLIYLIRIGNGVNLKAPKMDEMDLNDFYVNQSEDMRKDNRLYTRFRSELDWHYYGGGYDLTQQLFDDIRDQYYNNSAQLAAGGAVGGAIGGSHDPNQALAKNTVFAVYIYTGAKLVVVDSYQKNLNNKHHNRSLFEQGSVVIVEDQLWMSVPYNKTTDNLLQQLVNWETFCNEYMTTEMAERVKEFENPVLFLGANESDYNTIAWNLTINYMGKEMNSHCIGYFRKKEKYLVEFERRCYLDVPEGGYIVGVEDWADGIREIEYRHKYEQLHRAIVRHERPERNQFTGPHAYELPPGEVWLKKIILNTNTDSIQVVDRLTGQPIQYIDRYERDIHIDIVEKTPEIGEAYSGLIGEHFNQKDHTIHPKEFNFSRFAGLPTDPMNPVNNELMKTYRVSPAAYPPVKIRTDPNSDDYRLFYLPQTIRFKPFTGANTGAGEDIIEFNLLTVFKHYAMDPNRYSTYDNIRDIYPTNATDTGGTNHIRLKLSETKHTFNEYEWKCRDNPYVTKYRLMNTEFFRLAIDGHYYELVDNSSNTGSAGIRPIGYIQSYYYELFDNLINDVIVANFDNIGGNTEQSAIGFEPITDNQLYDLVNSTSNGEFPFDPNPNEPTGSQSGQYRQSDDDSGPESHVDRIPFPEDDGPQLSDQNTGRSNRRGGQYTQSRDSGGSYTNQFPVDDGSQHSDQNTGRSNRRGGQYTQSRGSGGSYTNQFPEDDGSQQSSQNIGRSTRRGGQYRQSRGSGGSYTNQFPVDDGSQQNDQNIGRGNQRGRQYRRPRGGGGFYTNQFPVDDGSQLSGQNTGRGNQRGRQYRRPRGGGGSNTNEFQGYSGSQQGGQNADRNYRRGGQSRRFRGGSGSNTYQSPEDNGSQQSGRNTGRSNRRGRQYRQPRGGDGSQQSGQNTGRGYQSGRSSKK